jgi:hypothetical protein
MNRRAAPTLQTEDVMKRLAVSEFAHVGDDQPAVRDVVQNIHPPSCGEG